MMRCFRHNLRFQPFLQNLLRRYPPVRHCNSGHYQCLSNLLFFVAQLLLLSFLLVFLRLWFTLRLLIPPYTCSVTCIFNLQTGPAICKKLALCTELCKISQRQFLSTLNCVGVPSLQVAALLFVDGLRSHIQDDNYRSLL